MLSDSLRIGVFVCDCGLNIAGTVDTAAVAEYAATIPDVAAVVRNKYTCADPGQNEIKRAIKEHNLNRVVVASCSPIMHEGTFRACVKEAGLNPYLLEMVNLREHCSWVHTHEHDAATAKAKDLVRSGVARVRHLHAPGRAEGPDYRRGTGHRRRRRRDSSRSRSCRRGASGLSCGKGTQYRRTDGAA